MFFPCQGWFCFLPTVASAFQKFSSQLQHLHPSNRDFHSNEELMPLPAGFLHNCFALVNPRRCSRNPDFAQASEACRGFKPQQCPLLYPMGTQGWVYVSQHKETHGFTSADKTEGLARWRSKEPPQANAGLKPSSTNICSSEVAPGDTPPLSIFNQPNPQCLQQ